MSTATNPYLGPAKQDAIQPPQGWEVRSLWLTDPQERPANGCSNGIGLGPKHRHVFRQEISKDLPIFVRLRVLFDGPVVA